MQLSMKELEGKIVKFLPWFDDFSTEVPPQGLQVFRLGFSFLIFTPFFRPILGLPSSV